MMRHSIVSRPVRPREKSSTSEVAMPTQSRPAVPGELVDRRWSMLQRELRLHWPQLSSEDVLRAAINRDALLSVLHEKYAYTQNQADREIEQALQKIYLSSVIQDKLFEPDEGDKRWEKEKNF